MMVAEMFTLLQGYWKRKKRARNLRLLICEVNGNLERYHVMTQQDVRKPFQLSAWSEERDLLSPLPAKLQEYQERVALYHMRLTEFLGYQRWYAEDIAHQNRENALVLEEKKEELDEAWQGLGAVITDARQILQGNLADLGA